jgi:aminoglycoside 6'-N-acetyltransferase
VETGRRQDPSLSLRPLAPEHAGELRRIIATPDVARWWDPPEDDFPLHDDPDSTRFAILVDGVVAGLIQFWEEDDPKYRHAGIDLFVDPARRGQGIGPAAINEVLLLLARRGHHRVVIDPAAANAAAIRAYEKCGFRPVGVMRAYERDADGSGWHDGLLMELLI